MLIRCIKKWRGTEIDAEQLKLLEFSDPGGDAELELELSVYEVSDEEWVRVFLEHRASIPTDPPRFVAAFDVSEICKSAEGADDEHPFQLARERHRIVRFKDQNALLAFVQQLLDGLESGTVRRLTAKKEDARDLLKSIENETEWREFLNDASKEWQKFPKAKPPTAASNRKLTPSRLAAAPKTDP